MNKKILSSVLGIAFAVAGVVSFGGAARAQSLPQGCTSNVGYSATTGASCNGATSLPAGCTSFGGFSATTGAPCNNNTVVANGGTTLPLGCTSSYGYGLNNIPCNGAAGTVNGINYYLAGCTSFGGYSTTTGLSCSTTSSVTTVNGYSMLPGCTSVNGYSTITGQACLGSIATGGVTDPGLPNTGEAGRASLSILMLVLSGSLAAYGITRLVSSKE